jgi:hypothetical protein
MRHSIQLSRFIVFVQILSLLIWTRQVHSGAPHIVSGTLKYADDTYPGSVAMTAYLLKRPGETLTESWGCSYQEGSWTVDCGFFPSTWSVGDLLHVDFNDGNEKTCTAEIFLTAEETDDAGVNVLTTSSSIHHDLSISIPDSLVYQGATVKMPVRVSELEVQDSVVAYQIKIGFEKEAVQAVGVSNTGTMTQMWGVPFSHSEEDGITIGAITTNQPSKRLIADGGILVYVSFLVQGVPLDPSSGSTLLRFLDAVVFTLDERIPVANTQTGLITVQESPSVISRQLILYPGANMVCLSVVPENPALPDILDNLPVSYIFGFQSDQDPPRSWEEGRPINDLLYLDGIHGYWMKFDSSSATVWSVSGTPVSVTTPLPVHRGWNLVGYLPQSADSIAHAFQTLEPYYNYILGYQGGEGPKSWIREKPAFLNDLNLLSPLSGYWVRMDSARTLIYPSGGHALARANPSFSQIQQDSIPGPSVTPWWCDFWAMQPELLSPGDVIRVFDGDSVLCGETQATEEGGFLVHVFGDDASTLEKDEGAESDETVHFVLNGELAEVVEGDPVWIDRGSKCVKLELNPSGIDLNPEPNLPKRWVLEQNYPNPFNSRTVIPYTLPLPSKVRICVYDVSGRLVRVLSDDQFKPAGSYRTVWDGKDEQGRLVASGVYFCRLQTDRIKLIRKMIFME